MRRRILLALPWIPLGIAAYVLVGGLRDTQRYARFVVYRPANGNFFVSPAVAFGRELTFEQGALGVVRIGGPGGVGMLCPQLDPTGRFDFRVYDGGRWRVSDASAHPTPVSDAAAGDIAFCADFDGDGVADSGIFRAGRWMIRASAAPAGAPIEFVFGQAGDKPIVVNLRHRGNATDRRDVVYGVYRAGVWTIDTDGDGVVDATHYFGGEPEDIPLLIPPWTRDSNPANAYSLVIFRNGIWYLKPDPDGTEVATLGFGNAGDVPSVYYGAASR